MNRTFISGRPSDGENDAHKLAVGLSTMFGPDTVFFVTHELHGVRRGAPRIRRVLQGY